MWVTIGSQRLLYGGNHRSSRAIVWGTKRFSRAILWGEGVPIGSEESKAIKGKAKRDWRYKDIRPKAIWNIKICAM